MIQYIVKQRQDSFKRLQELEREALTLRGGLAALDDILEQARKRQNGGDNAVAPPAPVTTAAPPIPFRADSSGIKALRIGNAPVQAEQELRG